MRRTGNNGVSDQLQYSLRQGARVQLLDAASNITVESVRHHTRVVMIAGGIGVTLLLALIREVAQIASHGLPVPDVTLLLCAPNVGGIPFLHELLTLDLTTTWFSLRVFVTRENVRASSHFHSGRPSLDFLRQLETPQAVVICGSHPFAHSFKERMSDLFPVATLLIESFTPLGTAPSVYSERKTVRLHIEDSAQIIEEPPGRSLLEILEHNGICVRSQCRSGICGSCRLKISSGACRFEPDFCLSEEDKRNGYALACCTFPVSGDVDIRLAPMF